MSLAYHNRIAELEEEVAWLRSELGLALDITTIRQIQKAFSVSRGPARTMLALYKSPRAVSRNTLEEMLPTFAKSRDHLSNVIDVYVCRLRKALGYEAIENIWGFGFKLTDQGRERVRQALEA